MSDRITAETQVVVDPWSASRPSSSKPAATGLKQRLAKVKASDLDLRNTWQVAVGAILLPLGLAVIILGWNGAAHGRVDQQQIPYIISGGVLGLALVLVGCFFFWAHWLYRIYDQADVHHQAAIREQTELLRAVLEAVSQRGSGTAGASSANGSAQAFVATQTGTNFHFAGCPMVANRTASLRPVSHEEAQEMRPCRVCDPLGEAG